MKETYFKEGDKVTCSIYGKGVVCKIYESGTVEVEFDNPPEFKP